MPGNFVPHIRLMDEGYSRIFFIHNEPLTYAKFAIKGPMLGALQATNKKIFNEWLPGNEKYELSKSISIEWYSCGDIQNTDYRSKICVPVK